MSPSDFRETIIEFWRRQFSSRPIVGMYLQRFSSPSDAKYYYTSAIVMTKRLNQQKDLRSKFKKRQKTTTCSSETVIEKIEETFLSASLFINIIILCHRGNIKVGRSE